MASPPEISSQPVGNTGFNNTEIVMYHMTELQRASQKVIKTIANYMMKCKQSS